LRAKRDGGIHGLTGVAVADVPEIMEERRSGAAERMIEANRVETRAPAPRRCPIAVVA
jgi:hypothetical protein